MNPVGAETGETHVQAESQTEVSQPATEPDQAGVGDAARRRALQAGRGGGGKHARGLPRHDRCRGLIAAELGCGPGPGLQSLYVRLLRGANEDNDELSHLLDSVGRLHMASQVGSGPASTEPGKGVRDEVSHTASVEQAIRSLNHLVRSVRLRPGHLAVALSA